MKDGLGKCPTHPGNWNRPRQNADGMCIGREETETQGLGTGSYFQIFEDEHSQRASETLRICQCNCKGKDMIVG